MHTTTSRDWTLIHHGDFSGDVTIRQGERELTVPASVLLDFAAAVVRQREMDRLESASTEELLRLK
ncbi:MAG TPA: hypothetical protein VGK73_13660 [Polyangiaceae bacterium]